MKLAEQLRAARLDKIPPGWFSAEELAKREGSASPEAFRATLKAALKAGLLRQRNFTVLWGDGCRPRPHYAYAKK